jgi:puromycin-sensitive aminopeptidase
VKDPAGRRGADPTVSCRVVSPGTTNGDTAIPSGDGTSRCTAPWVFVNAGATGYYRSEYSTAVLAALAPDIQRVLSAPERLSLLGDVWALVRVGRQSVGDFLTLASGFSREQSSVVVGQLAGRLGIIRTYLTTSETKAPLEAYIRRVFEPLAKELGPNTIPGEPAERTSLRAYVTAMLGDAGGDPATITYAQESVQHALAGRAALDPTSAAAYINLAAKHGDRPLFEAYLKQIAASVSPEDRYRYLYALSQFPDPALVQRGLALVLAPDFRSQDVPQYLNRFLANPATNAAAWAFVKANWSALGSKALNFLGDIQIANGLGSFCDARTRDDISAFFEAHPLPSGMRALRQSIDRINTCITLREAQTGALTTWLRENR